MIFDVIFFFPNQVNNYVCVGNSWECAAKHIADEIVIIFYSCTVCFWLFNISNSYVYLYISIVGARPVHDIPSVFTCAC